MKKNTGKKNMAKTKLLLVPAALIAWVVVQPSQLACIQVCDSNKDCDNNTYCIDSFCQKAALRIKPVAPCDQSDALAGAQSFRISFQADGKTEVQDVALDKLDDERFDLISAKNLDVHVAAYASVDRNYPPIACGAAFVADFSAPEAGMDLPVMVGKRGTFARTTKPSGECSAMATPRHGHTATYMPGVAKVLIVGGAVLDSAGNENLVGTAELFDPATGEFTELPEPPGGPRVYHAATALLDGRVLVTGGLSIINETVQTVAHGFVYDPRKTQDPYTLVTMPSGSARAHHTSTLVDTGELVLLVGGCSNRSGQICTRNAGNNAFKTTLIFDVAAFDHGSATLAPGPDLPDNDPGRVFHVALPVIGGRVLIAGGTSGGANPVCQLLLFEAGQRQFNAAIDDTLPAAACTSHLAGTTLPDGRVLLSGGYKALGADGAPTSNAADRSKSTTIWDVNPSQRVSSGPDLVDGRAEHSATAAEYGALIVGGVTGSSGAAELINLDAATSMVISGPPSGFRAALAAVKLATGQPLLLGGMDTGTATTEAAGELFFGGFRDASREEWCR